MIFLLEYSVNISCTIMYAELYGVHHTCDHVYLLMVKDVNQLYMYLDHNNLDHNNLDQNNIMDFARIILQSC